MLHLIRNNSPFTVLILFIFALLAKLQALLHPVLPAPVDGLPLYNLVVSLAGLVLRDSAFGFTLLTVLLLFFQGLYLNAIVTRHRMFTRPTYIPVYTYILCTSLMPAFSYFGEQVFINWCLLGAFDIMMRFAQPVHPRKHIFNAGLLAGMSGLFGFSSLNFVLLLFLALLLLRSFNIGEWVVAMLGLVTPVYFLSGILFLGGHEGVLGAWPAAGGWFLPARPEMSLYLGGLIPGLIILAGAGLVVMQAQVSKSAIHIRRGWWLVVCWLLLSAPVALLAEGEGGAAWLVSMPALSLVMAQPLFLEKNKRLVLSVFWFSMLLLVFCQVTFNR